MCLVAAGTDFFWLHHWAKLLGFGCYGDAEPTAPNDITIIRAINERMSDTSKIRRDDFIIKIGLRGWLRRDISFPVSLNSSDYDIQSDTYP